MRNKIIYRFGCILGGGLLFLAPIIERLTARSLAIGIVDLASIGSLILGVTLLVDYYGYHGDAEQYKNWWKQIAGYFFTLLFLAELLPLSSKTSSILNVLLYTAFLLTLYIRYNQLKVK